MILLQLKIYQRITVIDIAHKDAWDPSAIDKADMITELL
jgi:hypothetical protein